METPSDNLISFIADYESFKDMPYRGQDSQNRTIGYGHVITSSDGTKYDNGISQQDALALLRSDISDIGEATAAVNKFCTDNSIQLTQNQFDSLVSFTFNTSSKWTETSTLKNVLLSNDFDKVGDAMRMWILTKGNTAFPITQSG